MNKKAQSMKMILIGIVVFSFFVAGGFKVYTDMAPKYDITVNETYSEPFNKMDDINEIADDVGNKIDQSEATVTDSLFSFVSIGYSGLKIMFGSWAVALQLASVVREALGLPGLVFTFLITILLIAIVTAIISALFNR